MAGLKQRHNAALPLNGTKETTKVADDASSSSGSPPPSASSSNNDLKGLAKRKSLKERSKIPASFYVVLISVFGLEYFSGMWKWATVERWMKSMRVSIEQVAGMLTYTLELFQSAVTGEKREASEYIQTAIVAVLVFSLAYVFLIAPALAGLWSFPRARKATLHRFMGLAYITQYSLAWVEFLTLYGAGAESSYLTHTAALNGESKIRIKSVLVNLPHASLPGIIQGYSAYFSFKVLPELEDAGYYSDKAVMSRNFVHENMFFTLFCVFGSVYYNEEHRNQLRTTLPGRVLEFVYVFFPYIIIRLFFPITRFSNAGTTRNGRSDKNQRFYEIATTGVKIFFLWAKYFLGFYVNFLVFLDKMTPKNWQFLHGMFLLNVGTVSLAMFLHTLRFRKVLPAKFTFSLYLVQIYATFSAIPMAWDMFVAHPKLCALAFSGILANMTRSRKIHGVWCVVAMVLLTQTTIDW